MTKRVTRQADAIKVTKEMIKVGLEEFLDSHYGDDPKVMLEKVFTAMAYASPQLRPQV